MRALPLLGAALWMAACSGTFGGNGDALGGPCAPSDAGALPLAERYSPLEVGASWTYDVTTLTAGNYSKRNVIEAYEDVGGPKTGIMGFRLHRDDVPPAYTLSWQQDLGRSVVRHREKSFDSTGGVVVETYFDPFKLRLDECAEHLVAGASWGATYNQTDITTSTTTSSKSEQWIVDGVDVSVTVPAGTFTTLNVSRVNLASGKRRQYWFAKGVGKVKEITDTGVMESLSAYSIP